MATSPQNRIFYRREKIDIHRAQPIAGDRRRALTPTEFESFIGSDMDKGAGKYLSQFPEPASDQLERTGLTGCQDRAVRHLA
jgi:hypothetical protein